jgi:autotransporter-associated beta strand protein
MTRLIRSTGWLAALFLLGHATAPAIALDDYYWNSADGTDWTATNAWQLNSTAGSPATWINGNRAVFDDGSGTVVVSTAVSAVGIEFSGLNPLTIAQLPASGGSLTLNAPITLTSAATATINAPIAGNDLTILRNTPALTAPSIRLGGANTFTGNLFIDGGGGFTSETTTVRIASAVAVPSTAIIGFGGRNSAIVFDTGVPSSFALPNTIVLNVLGAGGTLPNLIRAGTQTSVSLNGVISGTGDLTFSAEAGGVGSVFTLTQANTYSGNTTVADGVTLLVNNPLSGSDSATGTGGLMVGGRIGGTGLIGGVNAATGDGLRFGGTGRLAPGDPAVNNGVGRLIVTRNVGWIANGTYEVQLGGLTDSNSDRDQLLTTGVFRIDAANATVQLEVSKATDFEFVPGQSYTYRIVQANDGIVMFGGAGGQFDPSRIEVSSTFAEPSDFVVAYEDGVGTANFLTLTYITPVPEPRLTLAASAVATGLWWLGTRRRQA